METYTVLTDIQGMEDHFGDMDFKVAGTSEGYHGTADGYQGDRNHQRRYLSKRLWRKPKVARASDSWRI